MGLDNSLLDYGISQGVNGNYFCRITSAILNREFDIGELGTCKLALMKEEDFYMSSSKVPLHRRGRINLVIASGDAIGMRADNQPVVMAKLKDFSSKEEAYDSIARGICEVEMKSKISARLVSMAVKGKVLSCSSKTLNRLVEIEADVDASAPVRRRKFA